MWRFVGVVIALFFIGLALLQDWIGLALIGLLILILLIFALVAGLWSVNKLYGANGQHPGEVLFNLSGVQPDGSVGYVDLGLHAQALIFSNYLTTGRLIIMDIYHPQMTPSRTLLRARKHAPPAYSDPRIIWYDSPIDLLPLPDRSITAVFAPQILSELHQHGDRVILLREMFRILRPNGRLLLSERTNTRINWLTLAPGITNMHAINYWRELLTQAGFVIQRVEDLQGLITCLRADKPSPFAGQQLTFDLNMPLVD